MSIAQRDGKLAGLVGVQCVTGVVGLDVDITLLWEGWWWYDGLNSLLGGADALVLIFAHFPAHFRIRFHQKLISFLKPGGVVILEGFAKNHAFFQAANEKAGGPKDPSMLFSKEELEEDFAGFSFLVLEERESELEEGLYHVGKSAVIRLVAKKN